MEENKIWPKELVVPMQIVANPQLTITHGAIYFLSTCFVYCEPALASRVVTKVASYLQMPELQVKNLIQDLIKEKFLVSKEIDGKLFLERDLSHLEEQEDTMFAHFDKADAW